MRVEKELEQVNELIETEKNKHLDRLITALLSIEQAQNEPHPPQKSSDDEIEAHDEEHTAMIALLLLRIMINCRMIHDNLSSHDIQLKEDVVELISNVKSLEYEWEISDTVKSDAYDLLCAICLPEDHTIIDRIYPWNLQNISDKGITPEMFFLFTKVAQYLHDIDHVPEAMKLLESLCTLSRERINPNHMELVCRVITQICEDSPETTCRICDYDQNLFKDEISLYSGDFYWFYGCALMKLGHVKHALSALEKCFLIRQDVLGESSFYTAVARREAAICKYTLSKGNEGKDDLKLFIDQIETGLFHNEIESSQLDVLEAKTLCVFLMNLSDIRYPDEYKRYLKKYGHLCQKYEYTGEPYISMRMAWNMRGGYYLNIGDYIRAESAFVNALKVRVVDEDKCVISRPQLQSNLLLVYYVQNDLEKAYPLAAELIDAIENDESGKYIKDADIYRIYTMLIAMETQAMADPDPEQISEIKNLLDETCESILADDLLEAPREKSIFFIICIFYLLQQEKCSISEQAYYLYALQRIEKQNDLFNLAPMQKTMLYYCQALVSWNIENTNATEYFKKLMDTIENPGIQHTQKAAMLQSYASYLCKNGEFNSGQHYIELALKEITIVWQNCVRYLNDYRLLMILTPVQLNFSGCYAIMRQSKNIGITYDQLLRFKALASLAGRERNRIIHSTAFDTELLDKIQRLQNAVAALESENMLRNAEKDYEELSAELRQAERDFSIQFPQNTTFTEISLRTVQDAIPDYSAVLEYFLSVEDYGQTQFESRSNPSKDQTVFDVYITTKYSGNCKLQKITIPNGTQVADDAKAFVLTMQHISTGDVSIEESTEIEAIRLRLYNAIIAPVMPMIEGYGTVYIAPDNELINLPFDLLYGDDKVRLADRHNCVKIECARDFLYGNNDVSSDKGTLIISDPEYDVKERTIEPERTVKSDKDQQRALKLDVSEIDPLPFSRVEAYRISSRIGGELYSGPYATKQIVLSARGYENIHIATHGYFHVDSEYASLYSSCLAFAGIKNWYRTGLTNPVYGSGLLTADEISRLDLSSTQLVILSSCLSGMNDVLFNTGFYGMVSALSAAGAKYVISNLWSANDFASAVFMDAFYYYYANGWNDPPIALSKARDYLRNVTIDELRRQGWFHPTTYQMLDPESRNLLHSLENKNGRLKPFRNECFWGGFTCYQCH